MSVIIRRNQKLKDQAEFQKDQTNIQKILREKEQEDKDERLFDMDIAYFGNRLIRNIWMWKYQAIYRSNNKSV